MRDLEQYYVIQNGAKISLYQAQKDSKGIVKPVLIRDFPEYKEITGTLHSGTAYEINNHMFLFDEKNMYILKVDPASCTVYQDLYCVGINCFNKSYNYALCQSIP